MKLIYLIFIATLLFNFNLLAGDQGSMATAVTADQNKVEKIIKTANQKMHRICSTKIIASIDYSELQTLEMNVQVKQFERLKGKVSETLENIFSMCKDSNFKNKLVKFKKIEMTASIDATWKVKANAGKLFITIGNSPGSNLPRLLESKIN